MSNRYELLADHADDGQWDMTNVGNSDDEERVNVVAGRECGTQCATSKKADWKLHRKVGVEVGAVETRIARVKSRERGMRFNVARVQKLLASAAEVVEAGNKISMGPIPDDNYIMNDKTEEKIAFRIDRGTFVFDVEFHDGEVGTITLDSGAGRQRVAREPAVARSDDGQRSQAAHDSGERRKSSNSMVSTTGSWVATL